MRSCKWNCGGGLGVVRRRCLGAFLLYEQHCIRLAQRTAHRERGGVCVFVLLKEAKYSVSARVIHENTRRADGIDILPRELNVHVTSYIYALHWPRCVSIQDIYMCMLFWCMPMVARERKSETEVGKEGGGGCSSDGAVSRCCCQYAIMRSGYKRRGGRIQIHMLCMRWKYTENRPTTWAPAVCCCWRLRWQWWWCWCCCCC